ncbi:mesoderm-specific transcript homolog protein-like [Haliotis rufescens]|uniref:mesoderm-specific transcript homolog protein-like n=1 Tax=Haliotis rufescens TaxID=6454 RepID=UPI00201F8E11|nr:mesoderm-specific transcript homolog protein-like [Haliotis rufescens]
MVSVLQVAVVVLGVAIAVFLFYPPPPFSQRLLSWKQRGKLYKHNDLEVFYIDEAGSGKGTVFCLHGFPTSSYDWIKIMPYLKDQFARVVLVDFPGMGFSEKPGDYNYSVFDHADVVEGLAQSLAISSTHILAHDLGDTIALELVARYKERLERSETGLVLTSLCLTNAGLFPGKFYPRLVQRVFLIPVIGRIAARFSFFWLFRNGGFGEVFGTKPTYEDFEDFYAAIRYRDGNNALPGVLHFIKERYENEDRWVHGSLKASPIPVLMVYGPADPVNPSSVFPDQFRKIVPQHKLVVLDKSIGHFPMWEDPDNTGRSYIEFIKGLRSNKPKH